MAAERLTPSQRIPAMPGPHNAMRLCAYALTATLAAASLPAQSHQFGERGSYRSDQGTHVHAVRWSARLEGTKSRGSSMVELTYKSAVVDRSCNGSRTLGQKNLVEAQDVGFVIRFITS